MSKSAPRNDETIEVQPRNVSNRLQSGKRPKAPLHTSIADRLGLAILSGEYPVGHVLPGEIEASNELQVSRSAYREAIRMLAAKGLLGSRPKAGTWVNPRSQWQMFDPQVVQWMVRSKPEEAIMLGVFEMRRIVEPAAVELAAARRTDDQIAAMKASLTLIQQHGFKDEIGREADVAFHHTLLEATHNPLLMTISSIIAATVLWTTVLDSPDDPEMRDAMPLHERVYEGIRARDGGAARAAMTELINLSMRYMDLTLATGAGSFRPAFIADVGVTLTAARFIWWPVTAPPLR